jgi:putative membrane protein
MYTLLLLAVIFANLPFLTTRLFAFKPMARKHIGHHLIELAAGFALTAALAYLLESRAGKRPSAGLGVLRRNRLPLSRGRLPRLCLAVFLAGARQTITRYKQ